MTDRLGRALIVFLLLLSLLVRSPLLFLLDALVLLVAGASALWGRYCLAGVSYARRLGVERLFCGEATDLWVEIVNAKPLPLAWLKTADEFPAEVTVQRAELGRASDHNRRLLNNLISVRWYELVRRHYRLTADKRGAFDFGPVQVSSGDIFGFRTRYLDLDYHHKLLVYPKLVRLEELGLRPARPLGEFGALRRVNADPLRLAGARDYQPGESIRHVHWKATARRGALQTKVFDPSAHQAQVIFLNSQTMARAHEGVISEYFETAIVVAASLAHAGLEARLPVGLFTNGGVKEAERRVRLPASRHTAQSTRILETLAQLTPFTFLPFETLLAIEAALLPYGATVIAVSAIVNEAILSKVLDLRAAGHPAALILIGQSPEEYTTFPAALQELPTYFVTRNWTEMEGLR